MMKNAGSLKAVQLTFMLIAICLVVATWQLSQPNCIIDPSKVVRSEEKNASLSEAALGQGVSRITESKIRSHLPHEELVLFEKKTNFSVVWMSPMEVNLVFRYMRGVRKYFEWAAVEARLIFHNSPQTLPYQSNMMRNGANMLVRPWPRTEV